MSQGTELLHGDYSSVCPNFSLLVFERLNTGQLSLSGELCSQRYWYLDSDLPFALKLGENFLKWRNVFGSLVPFGYFCRQILIAVDFTVFNAPTFDSRRVLVKLFSANKSEKSDCQSK